MTVVLGEVGRGAREGARGPVAMRCFLSRRRPYFICDIELLLSLSTSAGWMSVLPVSRDRPLQLCLEA